ncbi:MAG: hypothetical protein R2715_15040 [Ilumatobacteraceae bacterium]
MIAVLFAVDEARKSSPMGGLLVLLAIGFVALKIGNVQVGGQRLDDEMSGPGLILAAIVVLGVVLALVKTKTGVDVMDYAP